MEAGFSLNNATVGILGLGLMGGSLAMSLKGQCARLIGFDSHLPTLELALSKNIIDQAASDSASLFPQVNLLILATPVPSIINTLQQSPALISNPCIIMDLGSTKQDIVHAMSFLPERFDPIGGHPICGKEKLGLENADPNLYQDAPFVITPLARTTFRAKSAAQKIVSAIGANLIEMTAEEHDRILAFTSHLPFLVSSALALATPNDVASFVGPGFKSTSRLAGTSSSMMMGVLQSNRKNVLNALSELQKQLSEINKALTEEDYSMLEFILNQSCSTYQNLTGN